MKLALRLGKYNRDAYLGITHLEEASRNFYKFNLRKANPRHEVYSRNKIMHYTDVNLDRFKNHGFVNYYVKRDDDLNYNFSEEDYVNRHPHDIEDMYH